MAMNKTKEKQNPIGNSEIYMRKLIDLLENSIIVDLAYKGFAYQTIRKVVGGDIHRITRLLKPIKKEIQNLRR